MTYLTSRLLGARLATGALAMLLLLPAARSHDVTAGPMHRATAAASTAPEMLRGVTLSGLEFGADALPGRLGYDYDRLYREDMIYLRERGHRVLRIPFRWERLQPTPGGPLDAAYRDLLGQAIDDARAADMKVILDLHNFCAFYAKGELRAIGAPFAPDAHQFADVWVRLSRWLRTRADRSSTVIGFDLMNEPNHCGRPMPTVVSDPRTGGGAKALEWVAPPAGAAGASGMVGRAAGVPAGLSAMVAVCSGSPARSDLESRLTLADLAGGAAQALAVDVYLPADERRDVVASLAVSSPPGAAWINGPEVALSPGRTTTVAYAPLAQPPVSDQALRLVIRPAPGQCAAPIVVGVGHARLGRAAGTADSYRSWEHLSQTVVDALRASGDRRVVFVESGGYATAETWPVDHPRAWISDRANAVVYSAHVYFDSYGQLLSYARELELASQEERAAPQPWEVSGRDAVVRRARYRIRRFADWCISQKVRCNVGEIGWRTLPSEDAAKWNAVGEVAYGELNEMRMGAIYWAVGRLYESFRNSGPYVYSFGAYRVDSTLNRPAGRSGEGRYPVEGFESPAPAPLSSARVIEYPENLTPGVFKDSKRIGAH